MQAVALPEAKEVTEDPGTLPQPDKVTQAYFEVTFSSFQSRNVYFNTESSSQH